MKRGTVFTDAGRRYAEAYGKQYTGKDLHAALMLYKGIVETYPDTKEAEYSRSQIQNIFRKVVPEDVLRGIQLDMALNYAKNGEMLSSSPV